MQPSVKHIELLRKILAKSIQLAKMSDPSVSLLKCGRDAHSNRRDEKLKSKLGKFYFISPVIFELLSIWDS